MSFPAWLLLAATALPAAERSGEAGLSGPAVRVRVGHVHRIAGDSQRLAVAAHAADVADQRHFGHRRGRIDRVGRQARSRRFTTILGTVAVVASMTNIVSGFLLTDRMLKMFKKREPSKS